MKPYIKKVEIRNYKTHRNTRITFGEGVNSIIGPNGVGKSNILEAIIFGLGERSPKNLRVSSFMDVVYNKRKDLDVSVSLMIIDENGTEHRFKRIYVPGKGEHRYIYNGRRVSRSSYIMNLMKLGGRGFKYVYIQQGDILNRANATPQDIREIIDEALGIKQYEEKKKEALKKLEEADIKLRTLEGKYSEVQRFIREYLKEMIDYHTLENILYLEKILESAEATRKKEDIVRNIEIISNKRVKLKSSILKIDDRLNLINKRLDDLSKKIDFLDKEIDNLEKNEFRTLFKKREEIREKRNEILKLIIEKSTEFKSLSTLIEDKKKEIKELKEKITESANEIKKQIKIMKKLEQEKESLIEEFDSKRKRLENIEKEIKELNDRWRDELNRISGQLKEEAEKLAESLVQSKLKQNIKEERRRLERRIKRLDDIIILISERINEMNKRIQELTKSVKKKKGELLRRKQVIRKMRKEIFDAEKLLRRLEKLIQTMNKEKNITKNYYTDSRKIYETAKTLKIEGCIGILGEMIKGPAEILSLLREVNPLLWYGLVVKTHDTAEKILNISRELGKNLSLLVLSDYSDKKVPGHSVINMLKYPKKIEPVVKELFGNILILSEEDEIIKAVSDGYSVIHITGDYIIGKGIWFRARKTKIHISKNTEKLREIRDRFASMIEKRKDELEKKRGELSEFENKYIREASRLSLITQNKKLLETQFSYFKEWKVELTKRLDELKKQVKKEETHEMKEKDSIESLRRELSKLDEVKKRLDIELNGLSERIKELTDKILQIKNFIQRYGETNKEKKERINKLKKEIKEIQRKKEEIKKILKERSSEMKEINKELLELKKKEKEIEEKIGLLKKKRDRLKEKYSYGVDLERKYNERRGRIEKLLLKTDYKLKELNNKLSTLNNLIQELGYGEIKLRKIENVNKILNNLNIEKEKLIDASKYSETRYYAHIENYKMYSIRRNEILKERDSILKFIEDIDRDKKIVFLEGFKKIKQRFGSMFNEIFPGSKVYIELVNPEDIDSDIQIYIEFRDKPQLPLSALSGGEKTAIIILFLMSVYSIKEDTVFLLDEIDAHLDLRNIENVAKTIKSQKKYSQIILVTLPGHDSMITIADYVIPVVFKKGVSRVFQMDKEHLERMIRK